MEFTDLYGSECSLQKSSLASQDAIWIGVQDASPQIMARDAIALGLKPIEGGEKDNGWVPFKIPSQVQLKTRMHLTQEQVVELLPALQYFAEHGELPIED